MTPTDNGVRTGGAGVEIDIDATPALVYELLADVTRMGEWSTECVRCRWIGRPDATRPGARFRGTSRNGWHRWSTVSTIVVADPGRQLAFDVTYFRLPVAGWCYRFLSNGRGGTLVSETVDDRRGRLIRALSPLITGARDRQQRNGETMKATLERLKVAAESAHREGRHPRSSPQDAAASATRDRGS